MPRRPSLLRLRLAWTLVLWAVLMQLCMPVAHAAMAIASDRGAMSAWCGDPSSAREAAAALPAEIREALKLDGAHAEHLAACAKLCAVVHAPALPPAPAMATWLPDAREHQVPAGRPATVLPREALRPPSHGPPTSRS
ncbi:DUF2946 family protein [Hydrogenophaga sp.]|uniref:DUF2946 family protein n=1 Tax=Hydrogenophaga sp. TaxID=1904254 RepID=UPI002616F29D|nr:DUF2946 family protein [Hydrogenophaga sp.]MCW5655419.1 hypothetical protein [Hydrogenophaga sp.]